MVEQLCQWSEINSGSTNLPGLHAMHALLTKAFAPLADETKSIELPTFEQIDMSGNKTQIQTGNCLFFQKRPQLSRRILLCGHMDTVFDKNHTFQQVHTIDDNHLNGPGVTDMKGGLNVMLHALSTFEQCDEASNLGWDVFINADEEIGSPASGPLLEDMASNYQLALVYEPAMTPEGHLAYDRKGSGKFTLVVKGKAAHAGRDFAKGRNAIVHLAPIILAIQALNHQRPGLTINVGKIQGGSALNMVPDTAVIKLDIRYRNTQDSQWILKQLRSITQQFSKEADYQVDLYGGFSRPNKPITPACNRLFERVKAVASRLDINLDWKSSGGCCDGNNLASKGLPVIDTLGVCGNHIHSEHEYVIIDSLVERSQLSFLLLMELARTAGEL